MNFFAYKTVAERYAKYRPRFHPLVIEKIMLLIFVNKSTVAGAAVGVLHQRARGLLGKNIYPIHKADHNGGAQLRRHSILFTATGCTAEKY